MVASVWFDLQLCYFVLGNLLCFVFVAVLWCCLWFCSASILMVCSLVDGVCVLVLLCFEFVLCRFDVAFVSDLASFWCYFILCWRCVGVNWLCVVVWICATLSLRCGDCVVAALMLFVFRMCVCIGGVSLVVLCVWVRVLLIWVLIALCWICYVLIWFCFGVWFWLRFDIVVFWCWFDLSSRWLLVMWRWFVLIVLLFVFCVQVVLFLRCVTLFLRLLLVCLVDRACVISWPYVDLVLFWCWACLMLMLIVYADMVFCVDVVCCFECV